MGNNELKIGDKAPLFCLPDQDGQEICLKDYAGKWVVLYFYPKDNTSGCTLEAIDFTQHKASFEKMNALVWGVSPDSVKSHRSFCDKKALSITLLSDSTKDVLQQYGVWQTKKMYGKEYLGVVRSTFLLGPDGTIIGLWRKVKVTGHAEEVLDLLKSRA